MVETAMRSNSEALLLSDFIIPMPMTKGDVH